MITESLGRGARPLLLIAASAALLFGCGDSEDETSSSGDSTEASASATDVTVTATEYEFDLSATPTADTESATFTNDGEEFHVMVFAKINEGYTVDEAVEAEGKKGSAEEVGVVEAEPGESATLKVKEPLTPGSYAMLCPLPGKDGKFHYELGQLEEFDIE